jgi:hypothetical protein
VTSMSSGPVATGAGASGAGAHRHRARSTTRPDAVPRRLPGPGNDHRPWPQRRPALDPSSGSPGGRRGTSVSVDRVAAHLDARRARRAGGRPPVTQQEMAGLARRSAYGETSRSAPRGAGRVSLYRGGCASSTPTSCTARAPHRTDLRGQGSSARPTPGARPGDSLIACPPPSRWAVSAAPDSSCAGPGPVSSSRGSWVGVAEATGPGAVSRPGVTGLRHRRSVPEDRGRSSRVVEHERAGEERAPPLNPTTTSGASSGGAGAVHVERSDSGLGGRSPGWEPRERPAEIDRSAHRGAGPSGRRRSR